MYFNRRGRGHYARICVVKLCSRCHGKGHEESSCPSPANMESVLATETPDPGDGTIAVTSFVATEVDDSEAVVCGHLQGAPVASDEAVGGGFIGGKEGLELALHAGEERKSWEAWYFDSESSGNISNSCKKILIYDRATSSCVSLVARIFRLKVHGNLVVEFQSGHNYVRLKLIDGAFVSSSGPACVKQGHTYLGYRRQITVTL